MSQSTQPAQPARFDYDGPPPGSSWRFLDDVTNALENLTTVLDVEDDVQVLFYQVCCQVTYAVAGVDEATVTLLDDSGPRTAATTNETVAELDRNQYRIGDGPCMQAARTGQVLHISIDEAQRQWPSFAAAARDAGFGSFMSAPLVAGKRFAGAINCYSADGHGFAGVDKRLLELYVTAVEAALRTHARYIQARDTVEQLRTALTTRPVIDQAMGILMAAHQISADEAFARLAQQSQRENVKLRMIAERLVDHAIRPDRA